MPRPAQISVALDSHKPNTPFRVSIAGAYSDTGARVRRWFKSRSAADTFAADARRKARDFTAQSFGLSDVQKADAARALQILAPFPDRTLTDAARLALARWEADAASVTLTELANYTLAHKETDGASTKHLQQLRSVLKRFARAHPSDRLASQIASADVDSWLRSLPNIGPVSRASYRRALSAAFALAVEKGWARANPVDGVKAPRIPPKPDKVLTPAQLRALLLACDPIALPWVALGAFAGLRPGEAQNLAWLDIGPETLRVRPETSKTRRNRFVRIVPVLRAWLVYAAQQREKLPKRVRKYRPKVGFPRKRFRTARRKAGLDTWPQDVLRHGAISHRWPFVANEGLLAKEFGTSPQMINSTYRTTLDAAAARPYWLIYPPGWTPDALSTGELDRELSRLANTSAS